MMVARGGLSGADIANDKRRSQGPGPDNAACAELALRIRCAPAPTIGLRLDREPYWI